MALTTFVGPVATKVYDPTTVHGIPNATLVNAGTSTLYLGQSEVTETNGFPFVAGTVITYPANAPAIYAIAASSTAASPTTTLTAAAAAGATSLTVTSGTSFTAGMVITIGSGASAETNTVSASGSTSITLTTALLYDHASGESVTADVTSPGTGGSITVHRGGR